MATLLSHSGGEIHAFKYIIFSTTMTLVRASVESFQYNIDCYVITINTARWSYQRSVLFIPISA